MGNAFQLRNETVPSVRFLKSISNITSSITYRSASCAQPCSQSPWWKLVRELNQRHHQRWLIRGDMNMYITLGFFLVSVSRTLWWVSKSECWQEWLMTVCWQTACKSWKLQSRCKTLMKCNIYRSVVVIFIDPFNSVEFRPSKNRILYFCASRTLCFLIRLVRYSRSCWPLFPRFAIFFYFLSLHYFHQFGLFTGWSHCISSLFLVLI